VEEGLSSKVQVAQAQELLAAGSEWEAVHDLREWKGGVADESLRTGFRRRQARRRGVGRWNMRDERVLHLEDTLSFVMVAASVQVVVLIPRSSLLSELTLFAVQDVIIMLQFHVPKYVRFVAVIIPS
jgi:hypothetical protein